MFIAIKSTDRDFPHIIIDTDRKVAYMPDRPDLALFGSTPLGMVEDVLYIMWELTPTDWTWKRELDRLGACEFDYHGVEFFRLQCVEDYVYYIDFGE